MRTDRHTGRLGYKVYKKESKVLSAAISSTPRCGQRGEYGCTLYGYAAIRLIHD